jgi:iron complex outermembrane receptor protein
VLEEGRPFGQFYGWKFIEFDASGHYVMERHPDSPAGGPVTDLDKTYIGDANPKLEYGWTNSFNYKNWDFQLFFRGTVGNKVLNHPRMAYAQSNYLIGANALNDPLIYELKEVPKYCSLYIEDGSHIRLDNLVLGYTFNTRNISWLDRARIYFSGQNVFVLHKVKGPDPEVDISRNEGRAPGVLDREFYPKAHTYSVGINLTF